MKTFFAIIMSSVLFCYCGSNVEAATYVGTMHGMVTSGSLVYYNASGPPYTSSFSSIPISITFSANTRNNVSSPTSHIIYPNYVINKVSVSIPNFQSPGFPYNSVQSNDLDLTPFGNASFSGDLRKGVFDVRQDSYLGATQRQSVHFFYEQPTTEYGSFVGGGSASLSTETGYYKLLFTLTDGTVARPALNEFSTLSTVPEPTSWMMLILGLGVVGATQRRHRRRTGSYILA